MTKLKTIVVLVVIAAVVSLGAAGCKDKSEHPGGKPPAGEHPSKQTPAPPNAPPSGEKPSGEHPK